MNNNYTESILSKNYTLIDTSSLMNDAMSLFIEKHKEFLKTNGIKIGIHVLNLEELKKHVESGDEEKAEEANRALNLIEDNMDIFQYVGRSYDSNRIQSTFADPMVLSELLINKPYCRQLLISNDEGLNSDAYGFLNSLNSVSGKKIFVCRIGKEGDLLKSNCVNSINANRNPVPEKVIIEKPVERIVEKVIEKPVYIEEKTSSIWAVIAAGGLGSALGYYISENKDTIKKMAVNMSKAIASAF